MLNVYEHTKALKRSWSQCNIFVKTQDNKSKFNIHGFVHRSMTWYK